MSDFEHQEYFQYHQQRFEAALKFATTRDNDGTFMKHDEAIDLADALLARLEETRTKK